MKLYDQAYACGLVESARALEMLSEQFTHVERPVQADEADTHNTRLHASCVSHVDPDLDLSFLKASRGTDQSDFDLFLLSQFSSPVDRTVQHASGVDSWWARNPSAPEQLRTEIHAGLTTNLTQLGEAAAAHRPPMPEAFAEPYLLEIIHADAGAKVSLNKEDGKEGKGGKGVEMVRLAQKRARQKAKVHICL